jgi:Na+-driven multidrug efflux pump
MNWVEKLKNRWKLESAWQVVVVLVVFACTGFTILFIKKPLLNWLAGEQGDTTLASVLYYLFILPLYNIVLLGYGFIFGQFNFFWNFEKRFMERFFRWFKREK